jgi:hypothetical protein
MWQRAKPFLIALAIVWVTVGLIAEFVTASRREHTEINICTLDHWDAYLETHANDDALRDECPFGLSNEPAVVIRKHWDEIDKLREELRNSSSRRSGVVHNK